MIKVETLTELEELMGITLVRYYPESGGGHPSLDISQFGSILASKVKDGDIGAIDDATHLIDADPHLPFGKLVKSELARALKQSSEKISETNRYILINRTISILNLEYCPREAEDYCKLIRKLGGLAIDEVTSKAKPRCEKSVSLVSRLVENAV